MDMMFTFSLFLILKEYLRSYNVENTAYVYLYNDIKNLSTSLFFHHNFCYFIFPLKV